MKILVTGGAGFIGSHTVDKLIREKCEVTVVDNLSTGQLKNLNPQAKFVNMDIKNPEIERLCNEERFDYVIHLAAQTMLHVSMGKPLFDCEENILGSLNILEACRKTGVKRVVFASSAAVYGYTETLPIDENNLLQPASFYGLSKTTVEKYLALYKAVYGLDYIVLRYANVFGERQGDGGEGGVISIFLRKIANNEVVTIFGDGGQTRDFIYVGDISAANYRAVCSAQANQALNISTGTEISINSILQIMQDISGRELTPMYDKPREGDIYRSCLNNRAADKVLGWQPKTSFAEGIKQTLESLK